MGENQGQQGFEAMCLLIAVRIWAPIWKNSRVTLALRNDNIGALTIFSSLKGNNLVRLTQWRANLRWTWLKALTSPLLFSMLLALQTQFLMFCLANATRNIPSIGGYQIF